MQNAKSVQRRLFVWLCLLVIGLQTACQPIQAPSAATIPGAVAPSEEASLAGTYSGKLIDNSNKQGTNGVIIM